VRTTSLLALAFAVWGSVPLHAADVSGVWQGGFLGSPFVLVFHQDGEKLSGTSGPSEKEQQKLENLRLEGDRIVAPTGPMQFDLRIQGETLTGDVTVTGRASQPEAYRAIFRRPGSAAAKPAADLKFEVASVKPAPAPDSGHRGQISFTRGQWLLDRVPLRWCITMAYGVGPAGNCVLVGPEWLQTVYCSIVAKLPPDSDMERNQTMFRNLLVERFKLGVHCETKEFSGYAVVPAKGGFKLHEAPFLGRESFGFVPGAMEIRMSGARLGGLARTLSRLLDVPVEDETGILGAYDILLAVPREESAPAPGGAIVRTTSLRGEDRAVAAAMQQQLGLRLEPRKLQRELVVVDHAEKAPVEN
jgi:uncharacterized protein (TIGR03435 family)